MTNITVTYGRKVPGQQEYSSEFLQVSMCQELGEAAYEESELRASIQALYDLLKQEVESKLGSNLPSRPQLPNRNGQSRSMPRTTASGKQVNYLLGLANQRGLSSEQLGQFLQDVTGKPDPYALTTREASQAIDYLKQP